MKFLLAILFLLSLCSAASDGPYFPIPNLIGVMGLIGFAVVTRLVGRRIP
jgi:hypothetical protein